MTRIKICGLFREEDIEYVNECVPDYIGFVFAQSRRRVTEDQAKRLRARLDADVIPVGVFVDAALDTIERLVREGVIAMVQLHGKEDGAYIQALKKRVSVPVIKAFRPGENTVTAADLILLDSASPGSGETFDWTMIRKPDKPFFLAGGLTPDNIAEAIRTVEPFAVDVSSGVETNGVKDFNKIIKLIDMIRGGR